MTVDIKNEDLNYAIKRTVMSIREMLMSYFKGTTSYDISSNYNIRFETIEIERRSRPYQYQRRQYKIVRPLELLVDGVPVLSVRHEPNIISIYRTLSQDPALLTVKAEIEKFMRRYLKAVQITYDDTHLIGLQEINLTDIFPLPKIPPIPAPKKITVKSRPHPVLRTINYQGHAGFYIIDDHTRGII